MRRTLRELIVSLRLVRFAPVLVLVFLGCRAQSPPSDDSLVVRDRPMVILYAFTPEGAQLREWAMIRTDTMFAGRRVAVGFLGMDVVIASSGMGMTNAAAMTQHVIDTYDPIGIIFTGIAGAISEKHQIGDIVIPDRWITQDYGYYGKTGLLTDSLLVGNPDSIGFARMLDIPVDTALHRQLVAAANSIAFRFRTVARRLPDVHAGGVGVSGNAFIDSKSKRTQLQTDLAAEIVDMESAAVVQTAHASGVPVVVVRSCSDLAGGSGYETATEEIEEFFKVAANNSALVVKQFLEMEW
ncbi:MAG TPA: 5'-methylthioadenosine/S-adenosylhomocysteine nucleosidase [Acidobacteriota bacterium]|nr:5'-methylthioadenosine/S-adenosylhomocysteine nucleosidase [Acidobacteriota bacterium]